jgi:D-alanine-D-alanine ligase
MDKALTNILADAHSIKQAKWESITRSKCCDKALCDIAEKLGYPIFVKPANAGSSVGISKAKDLEQLKNAADKAFLHDNKVVFEEFIDGFEVECAVLGNDDPIASVVGQIVPGNEFYDYDAKYISESKLFIPAEIDPQTAQKIRSEAIRIYEVLGCSGISRVDFFVSKFDNCVLFNEINTIPGFTSISMYPKMFEACGIPYTELLDKILGLAVEKWSVKEN